MRKFDDSGPRADGPPVVWTGPEVGPALVVIDPSGAARHAELPPTWRQLTQDHQVAWCRVPASRRSVEDIEDVLESLAERQAPSVTMVAAGEACSTAIEVARQFESLVTQILLVDPTDDTPESARVTVVARSAGEGTSGRGDKEVDPEVDRVPAPLPLGHPDVVAGVVAALSESDRRAGNIR
ncbi:hypothetical protein [Actinophytocola xanthii]|uniref:Alpha/beta hydrolase n=1 Tax=Actinophytocola xanthii TaxID=1912961 RepID=A0A1Q8CGA3_9PSEU|nr:hypothetical protein [Actinophytocola xanthii]OLF13399.1 hypothetical protein BU204_27400 [Actinophytocola xanthii]